MKRLIFLLLLTAAALCFASGALAQTRIMVVSDTHYLSHALYEKDNPYFTKVVSTGAGKATMYSDELLDALLAEARHQRPDLLLITGDITFNGEAASHADLAEAMRALQREGIRVAVIPGNHDINNRNAVRFTETGIEWVDNVDSAAFGKIWQGMLADELPGPGFSGVLKLNGQVWLALGDYSVYEDHQESHGVATGEHERWMAGVLDAAAGTGAAVISASHQPLLSHTDFSSHTFRVIQGDKIADLLDGAGMQLNLCGHMHIQHILRRGQFADIITGAWCTTPHRYGIATLWDDGTISSDAYAVCDEHLPQGLGETIRQYFLDTIMKGERVELMAMGVFDQKLLDMSRFAARVNEYYYAGTLAEHPEVLTDPARALWEPYERGSTFAHYLLLILREEISDALHWSSGQ
ncbi:MAG: metallophosphoesterase [Clostridia bacterium]|nr:metallophosphoesterase [Clostridia bacterium]